MSSRAITTSMALVIGFIMFMMIALPAISDSNDGKFFYKDGSRAMGGNLDMGGNTIKNLGAGLTFDSLDIDGGTIDGAVIGGAVPAAGTFTTLIGTAGTIDGATIGGVTPGTGTFTTLNATGGGALTGTWTDIGSITTGDWNGGSIDGTTIGGAVPRAGTFTSGFFTSATIEAASTVATPQRY